MTPGAWLGRVAMIVVAVFFVLFFVIPIVWLLLASSKSPHDLITTGAVHAGFVLRPGGELERLVTFQDGVVFTWLGNSVLYSRRRPGDHAADDDSGRVRARPEHFRGRQLLLTTTLVVMLIPNTALVLPIFLELSAVGLDRQAAGGRSCRSPSSRSASTSPTSTSRPAVPRDLLDAARIDGCGELEGLPACRDAAGTPVIALVGFFSFAPAGDTRCRAVALSAGNGRWCGPVRSGAVRRTVASSYVAGSGHAQRARASTTIRPCR